VERKDDIPTGESHSACHTVLTLANSTTVGKNDNCGLHLAFQKQMCSLSRFGNNEKRVSKILIWKRKIRLGRADKKKPWVLSLATLEWSISKSYPVYFKKISASPNWHLRTTEKPFVSTNAQRCRRWLQASIDVCNIFSASKPFQKRFHNIIIQTRTSIEQIHDMYTTIIYTNYKSLRAHIHVYICSFIRFSKPKAFRLLKTECKQKRPTY